MTPQLNTQAIADLIVQVSLGIIVGVGALILFLVVVLSAEAGEK